MRFGYLDQPNVPQALAAISDGTLKLNMTDLRYFLGRENVIATPVRNMAAWREKIFVLQFRTAASAARFFHLPADRVFEVGTTVEI